MLTPGENPSPESLSGVFQDHLKFAYRCSFAEVESELLGLFAAFWADDEALFVVGGESLTVTDRAGNFAESRTWAFRGLTMFRVLTPSKSTRGVGHVVIDGQSCRLVRPEFWRALALVGGSRAWDVRRLDAAVDDDSRTLNPDVLQSMYDRGDLAHQAGGAQRLFDPRDPRRGTAKTGWTVYLGAREADTCFAFGRIYDKHAQMLAVFGEAVAAAVPVGRVRLEIEWKSQKRGKRVAWEMVADPAPYFAADCALMQSRAGGVRPVRVGRVYRDRQENALVQLLTSCRDSYGGYIDQAFWSLGGDDEAARVLVGMLRRPGAKRQVAGVAEAVGGGVPDRDYAGPGS